MFVKKIPKILCVSRVLQPIVAKRKNIPTIPLFHSCGAGVITCHAWTRKMHAPHDVPQKVQPTVALVACGNFRLCLLLGCDNKMPWTRDPSGFSLHVHRARVITVNWLTNERLICGEELWLEIGSPCVIRNCSENECVHCHVDFVGRVLLAALKLHIPYFLEWWSALPRLSAPRDDKKRKRRPELLFGEIQ